MFTGNMILYCILSIFIMILVSKIKSNNMYFRVTFHAMTEQRARTARYLSISSQTMCSYTQTSSSFLRFTDSASFAWLPW